VTHKDISAVLFKLGLGQVVHLLRNFTPKFNELRSFKDVEEEEFIFHKQKYT